MDDKELIKLIRDKLSHHRVDVSDDLWSRVSDALPSTTVWYKRKPLYAAVAAVAVLVVVSVWLCNDSRDIAVLPHSTHLYVMKSLHHVCVGEIQLSRMLL